MNVKHHYYYQVQMQMFVAEVDICDFVVFNPKKILIITISTNFLYEFNCFILTLDTIPSDKNQPTDPNQIQPLPMN